MGKNIHPLVIGIDEAGRGPLLGDMVLSMLGFHENDLSYLARLGVRDSKKLTRTQRSLLFKKIFRQAKITGLVLITPKQIDASNINRVIADHIVYLFTIHRNYLIKYPKITVFADEIKGYNKYIENKISKLLPNLNSFCMEEKADAEYLPVSAASIVAKYVRDMNIGFLSSIFGEIGSGYPSDPVTIHWLSKEYETHRNPLLFIRRSWSTLKKYAPSWYKALKVKRGKNLLEYIGAGKNGDKSTSRG